MLMISYILNIMLCNR